MKSGEVTREYFLDRLHKVNMQNIEHYWQVNQDLIK